jgi:hypothetical protein
MPNVYILARTRSKFRRGWGGGSLEFEAVKCGHESRGSRTRERLRWRGSAAIVNYRPILSSERILHKEYDCKCPVEGETKISGRESQGACRQDELIGGKPPLPGCVHIQHQCPRAFLS